MSKLSIGVMKNGLRGFRGMALLCVALLMSGAGVAQAQKELLVGIGTQNTTTNTVTGGIVIKELGLLEKHLPKTGIYKDLRIKIDWQNFTSGPPITNGMMADKIHIGMMGDYPLLVNGATGQNTRNETQLVAIIAYNEFGGGNGLVVHKDSPFFELADLKGKNVSVPFGSAAHGMLLQAMQARGWPENFWNLSSQSPEVGMTNLQERRIDGHANFVPFMELMPFRGFARKIFDGAETRIPTFHGVVVRKDFGQNHPDIVVAYIKALMEANDWVRRNPKLAAEKIAEWTKIDKEVVYAFLGPGGIHTLDPTIKPKWLDTIKTAHGALAKMGRIKDFNERAWVNDIWVRQAFRERGLDYEKQRAVFTNYEVTGKDPVCNVAITRPREAGQIWIADGDIVSFSSPACTLAAVRRYRSEGKRMGAVYLTDQSLGIRLFADKAFYAIGGKDQKRPVVVPFLLKKDAEGHAAKIGGRLGSFDDAVAAVGGA
ncbi:MAG: ABC transporter substrate-binding protein [Betaproteobacteria bacterium]|jgi:NitT/TauT family transport system substrate-binding protein|nr:ABC transporter substrate-binding protein [Betaproteobacteria bacterium]